MPHFISIIEHQKDGIKYPKGTIVEVLPQSEDEWDFYIKAVIDGKQLEYQAIAFLNIFEPLSDHRESQLNNIVDGY